MFWWRFFLLPCIFDFSVGVRACVIGLSHVPSFSLIIQLKWIQRRREIWIILLLYVRLYRYITWMYLSTSILLYLKWRNIIHTQWHYCLLNHTQCRQTTIPLNSVCCSYRARGKVYARLGVEKDWNIDSSCCPYRARGKVYARLGVGNAKVR